MSTDGLKVNLERTAVEVDVPDEQKVLLDIVAPYVGVHRATEHLLVEINHAYVGWPETVSELHARAMGDFHRYNAHDRGGEAIAVICRLYDRAVGEATPVSTAHDAFRYWTMFLDKVATESGERLEVNGTAIGWSAERISFIIDDHPELSHLVTGTLGDLLASLTAAGDAPDVAIAAVRRALAKAHATSYDAWLTLEDPARWLREHGLELGHQTKPSPWAVIDRRSLERDRDLLRSGDGSLDTAALLAMRDDGALIRAYRDATEAPIDGAGFVLPLDVKAAWLCDLLGEPLLESIHDEAIWALARVARSFEATGDDADYRRFIDTVFDRLQTPAEGYTASALDLVRSLGIAAAGAEGHGRLDHVIDRILDVPFRYADFEGFTDDWAPIVDPHHVRNIRTYLGIIEADPERSVALIRALTAHLSVGDVFVADTDLFQRDISALLAAGVEPVYRDVLHLLRRFPVYFTDIGAEGELRRASTQLDEMHGREDPLVHFLRKQSHVESNPALVDMLRAAIRYWAGGGAEAVSRYVPDSLADRLRSTDPDPGNALGDAFSALARAAGGVDELDALGTEAARELLSALPLEEEGAVAADLALEVLAELEKKYALTHDDLSDRLRELHAVPSATADAIDDAIDSGDYHRAIDLLLDVMERLRGIVVDPSPTVPMEDIYRKRHIGTGIPSMYGRYREQRVEAVGLGFRCASLVASLLDRVAVAPSPRVIDRSVVASVRESFGLLLRALEVEGNRSEDLLASVRMLDEAFAIPELTREELVDVFTAINHAVDDVVHDHVARPYGRVVERIAARDASLGSLDALQVSETVVRMLLAETLGFARIDRLATEMLHLLHDPMVDWSWDASGRPPLGPEIHDIATYDGEAGSVVLGNKGRMLVVAHRAGLPVPKGFIITTPLSRAHDVDAPSLDGPLRRRIEAAVGEIEEHVGRGFGDPDAPLLLSVRSGAPVSMPGMLDSFLDVGIGVDRVPGLSRVLGSEWGAWDSYRRFLQLWGMSHGIPRDAFDALMAEAKAEHGVERKAYLAPDQMRDLSFAYSALLRAEGVEIVEEPWEQLHRAIELVVGSWHRASAARYREAMGIAHGWGTAVIVQRMVFGNRNLESGTGVAIARRALASASPVLWGDYVVQGQGDDIVSGLVRTFPVSAGQEERKADNVGSLEDVFPGVHGELTSHAATLLNDVGLADQEIEFTFESPAPGDVWVLQTRHAHWTENLDVTRFVQTRELEKALLGRGIGVWGGAGVYRIAIDDGHVADLRRDHPGDHVLLVRPDTVPEDIELLLRADALLTAVGGATSHAAVVARRIGKTCVVGCRGLQVNAGEGTIAIGGRILGVGSVVSVNGADGAVYAGAHAYEAASGDDTDTQEDGTGP